MNKCENDCLSNDYVDSLCIKNHCFCMEKTKIYTLINDTIFQRYV